MINRSVCILIALGCFALPAPINADTVDFVDGNRVENVRVLLFGGRVNLIFEGGAIQIYREEQIARISNAPVSWSADLDEQRFEREARLRIFKLQSRVRARERERLERAAAERRYGLYLSLAFPGLGQFARGSPVRGSLFAGVALVLGASIANASEQRHNALRAYENTELPYYNIYLNAASGPLVIYVIQDLYFRDRFAAFQRARDTYDALWLSLLFVWAWNAVDAYFFQGDAEYSPEAESAGTTGGRVSGGWPDFSVSQDSARIRWSFAL